MLDNTELTIKQAQQDEENEIIRTLMANLQAVGIGNRKLALCVMAYAMHDSPEKRHGQNQQLAAQGIQQG